MIDAWQWVLRGGQVHTIIYLLFQVHRHGALWANLHGAIEVSRP